MYAACTECRRRRRKCDGNEPCEQCASFGYPCAYSTTRSTEPSSPGAQQRHAPASEAGPSPSANTSPAAGIIVSKAKGRFINAHSAVALPHLAGREIAAAEAPRLHTFAWNLGIRPEKRGSVVTSLSSYLTLTECRGLASTYFAAVHPLLPFLSEDQFLEDMSSCWNELERRPNFAAVVAGVATLGSFFSEIPHPREEDIKRHCFSVLDLAFTNPASMVDIDSVAGWILRTLYVRLTTRPAISCMASHVSMHMAEILSLQRDIENVSTATTGQSSSFSRQSIEARRRHYWVARFLNQLLSIEYGLAPVRLPKADCPPPIDSHTDHIVTLSTILDSEAAAGRLPIGSEEMSELFTQIQGISDSTPSISLFKAEVCLCLLRRHLAAGSRPIRSDRAVCCNILRQAFTGIRELLQAKHTWWSIIGVPFQIACLAVAFDTHDFLALLPSSMEVLRLVADTFDTHMSKEALHTAQQLISGSRDGVNAKLELQNSALSHALPLADVNWPPLEATFDMLGDWPLELDIFTYGN